jgi:hypothetical protein
MPLASRQAPQGADDLHPVIRRVLFGSRMFDSPTGGWMLHDEGPAAWAWIAAACAVGEQFYVIFRGRLRWHIDPLALNPENPDDQQIAFQQAFL